MQAILGLISMLADLRLCACVEFPGLAVLIRLILRAMLVACGGQIRRPLAR